DDWPVDYWTLEKYFAENDRMMGVAGLAGDPAVGIVLAAWTTTPFYTEATRAVAEELLASGKAAIFAVLPGAAADGPRAALRELGVPVCETLDDALRMAKALAAAARHALAGADAGTETGEAVRPEGCAISDRPPPGLLTEPAAKALLAGCGIAVTREALAQSPEEAASAAAGIGYPIALKVVSPDILHKSDAGGVALGLDGPDALAVAWTAMAARLAEMAPDAAIDGFLVQEMRGGGLGVGVGGGVELLIGARRDPQFGPIVVFGTGGTLVELLRDVSVAAAPLSAEAAERLIRASRVWPLLAGWRGAPPADLGAVVEALVRISWLAHDLGEALVELEANPLLAEPDGAVVLDARGRIEG
ncbi:MAG: acetate--CoA ligase family protein, partial [Rhodospirillaceae bacterium]|nr:acetate--CoA ligase family protein [Rhodospirillaceae bacterium]